MLTLFKPNSYRTVLPSVSSFFNDSFFDEILKERENKLNIAVNVIEEKDKYIIKADVPGIDEKDVKIQVKDGILSISGERKIEKEENEKFFRKEIEHGYFCRTFNIDGLVDDEKINANYKNGVLTLLLPKKEEVVEKVREIPIQTLN